jgi:hypothetical protein
MRKMNERNGDVENVHMYIWKEEEIPLFATGNDSFSEELLTTFSTINVLAETLFVVSLAIGFYIWTVYCTIATLKVLGI